MIHPTPDRVRSPAKAAAGPPRRARACYGASRFGPRNRNAGATIRSELAEQFQPHGLTCVLILAESHLTVSTWPEHNLAHIDVFTCRADTDPDAAVHPILTALGGDTSTIRAQRVPRIAPTTSPTARTPRFTGP
jgi:S-adenosylmethionine decarboxylase proenzyme